MIPIAALAAALLAGLSADPAAPPSAPLVGEGDVRIEAGRLRSNADTGRLELQDGVVLRRGVVTLRARTASYDPATGEVQAVGGVLLTEPGRAIAADGIRLVLGGPFHAEGVVAFVKDGPVPLGDAATIEEARRAGQNRVAFSGGRLEGDGRDGSRFTLRDARLTLCDCAGGAPSWEVRARKAEVVPGERATLSWPVLWITPRFVGLKRAVPVLPLPWIYLPLGDRHTGLLVPEIGLSSSTGLQLAQPLFVTLGRSADATITPEWRFGPGRADFRKGDKSIRGGGLRLELRWAPAEGAEGELELHGVRDLDREVTPEGVAGAGGDRLGITGRHAQRLGEGGRLELRLALASDPVWFRDLTSDVLARSAFYSRSAALLSHRSDALVAEVSAAYDEPLTPSGRATSFAFGTFGRKVPVFQRWPSLGLTLLPLDLGPLAVSGRAGLSRFAPVDGGNDLEALGPSDPGATFAALGGAAGGALDPRRTTTRIDGRAEVRLPLSLAGGVLRLEPSAGAAGAGYFFDEQGSRRFAGWLTGGLVTGTELARRYAAGTHRIGPRLELRAGTKAYESGPAIFGAYDPWDRAERGVARVLLPGPTPSSPMQLLSAPVRTLSAAPAGAYTQLRAAVENRFTSGALQLRLDLGQDFDLRSGRAAETYFEAAAGHARFGADVAGRLLAFGDRPEAARAPARRSALDDLTELRASLHASDARGDGVQASFLAIGPGASGALMAGVDPLFDLRPSPAEPTAQGALGLRAALGPALLSYDALIAARRIDGVKACTGSGTRTVDAGQVQQHSFSATWDSPCHCFVLRAALRVDDCGEEHIGFSIDLSRLGERARVLR